VLCLASKSVTHTHTHTHIKQQQQQQNLCVLHIVIGTMVCAGARNEVRQGL